MFEKVCDELCAEKEEEIERRNDKSSPTAAVEKPPVEKPLPEPMEESPKMEIAPKLEAQPKLPEPVPAPVKQPAVPKEPTVVVPTPVVPTPVVPKPVEVKPTQPVIPTPAAEPASVAAPTTRKRENARAAVVMPADYAEKQQKEKQHQKEINNLNQTPMWLVRLQQKRYNTVHLSIITKFRLQNQSRELPGEGQEEKKAKLEWQQKVNSS